MDAWDRVECEEHGHVACLDAVLALGGGEGRAVDW